VEGHPEEDHNEEDHSKGKKALAGLFGSQVNHLVPMLFTFFFLFFGQIRGFVVLAEEDENQEGDNHGARGNGEGSVVGPGQCGDVVIRKVSQVGERGSHLLFGQYQELGGVFQCVIKKAVSQGGNPFVVYQAGAFQDPVADAFSGRGSKERAHVDPHIENVEGVVPVFAEAGIIVHVPHQGLQVAFK